MNVNAGHEKTSKARIIHQIQPIRGITAFQRIIHRAGIFDKEVCIHTCRHSVAALIVSYGGTLYDVQAQLGHRCSQSSQRYAHIHPQRLQNTSQLLAERITAQLPSLEKNQQSIRKNC
ncbi:tyrosine-type recombinase/integrase [Klebsiella aerogenes]|uniref:tyrosine-type recombinase/integrase n=1 Tax=Klebsiella aerogenes TaxID=548 RepID=UPI003CFC8974